MFKVSICRKFYNKPYSTKIILKTVDVAWKTPIKERMKFDAKKRKNYSTDSGISIYVCKHNAYSDCLCSQA